MPVARLTAAPPPPPSFPEQVAEQSQALHSLGLHVCQIIALMHRSGSFLCSFYAGPPGLWGVKRHVLQLRDGLRRAGAEQEWLDSYDMYTDTADPAISVPAGQPSGQPAGQPQVLAVRLEADVHVPPPVFVPFADPVVPEGPPGM